MIIKKRQTEFYALIFILGFLIFFSYVSAIEPDGASVSVQNSSRAPTSNAGSVPAQAGNVTELNIFGYSSTQTWQGYYGNVTGTIQLADGSGNVPYNWTLASPQGEVYASTNQSITWTSIQCFNYTANGSFFSSETAGSTSLYGLNLTQLESRFNILPDDVDGVNETFNLIGAGTHDIFYTTNQVFSEGECPNTRVFDSSGAGVSNNFENVLLYEPVSTSVVFAAILDENVLGFDSTAKDFEMLVLEDGHGTDVASTPYYFYVELQ